MGREPLHAKHADPTPEKDLNRARRLRFAAHTHSSTSSKQIEKRNKGPESLLYKKRSKLVSDNTKKKSFGNRLTRSDKQGIKDSYDLYDIILSHLLDEGYAETQEQAEVIMVNMSEDWRVSICEAAIEPPRERVGALTNIDIPEDEKEAARKRTLAKAKAMREKKKN